MLHLLQPSIYEIIPYHMTCSLIRAKTYIVNRFLSLHQCSIILQHEIMFQMQTHSSTMLQPDMHTAPTAAATVFTEIDLNVCLCREVIICVRLMCVCFVEMTNPKINVYKRFTRMLTDIHIITVLQPKNVFCFQNTKKMG